MKLFIDTNILLSFFHLTKDELEELKKLNALIDKGEIDLILPRQVVNEFERNRENKISDSLKRLRESTISTQYPQMCKDYPEYITLRESLNAYMKAHSALLTKIQDDVNGHLLAADKIINDLFNKASIIEYDQDVIDKAKLRMELGNPPGKNGSLGDAINWETVLKHGKTLEDIHFVADDKDYYSVLDNEKINEFLSKDWNLKNLSDVKFYRRLSLFFKENFPEIKLASEIEKELQIKQLRNSGSFATTHTVIDKLSTFAEFTASQVDEILSISLTNTQIRLIVTDLDVKEFLENIIKGKEEKLNSDNVKKIKKYLTIEDEPSGEALEELFK